jgi:hypothetical protein
VRSGNLCIFSLFPFLFDLVDRPSVFLLWSVTKFFHFQLQVGSSATPGVAISLDLVALVLKVGKSFFKGCGKLFLCSKVFLNGPDTGLLVFLDLGDR